MLHKTTAWFGRFIRSYLATKPPKMLGVIQSNQAIPYIKKAQAILIVELHPKSWTV